MSVDAKKAQEIRLPAIEIRQGPKRTLYSFAVDGKMLPKFSTISRLSRSAEAEILGYQRPESLAHISEIKKYIESESPMIPNSIVIAFDKTVRFEPIGNSKTNGFSRIGELIIPIYDEIDEHQKPGWIVDGQQRSAAIRDAEVRHFPISVVGFIAKTESEQREQFILVNSTKPLPKGLIYELLPSTNTHLPSFLERRKMPTRLLERLNYDSVSPLRGLIKTPTNHNGIIADNSILKMLENSLNEGSLYQCRKNGDVLYQENKMLRLLFPFWKAVKDVFPKAWGLKPKDSRLMHGVGIVGMGFLMDAIYDHIKNQEVQLFEGFKKHLVAMKNDLFWTEGTWDFGGGVIRKWNEIQNIPRDIQLVSCYILSKFKERIYESMGSNEIIKSNKKDLFN